jgi:hypothetical protein
MIGRKSIVEESFSWLSSAVSFLGFSGIQERPILLKPKGGEAAREGWAHTEERYRERAPMTFTFKLSRRLARFRAVPALAAILVAAACSEDANAPTNLNDGSSNTQTIQPGDAVDQIQRSESLVSTTWRNSRKSGKVTVSPATTTLAPGASQSFTASTPRGDGNRSSSSPQWSATGGQITSSGRYTAGQTPGTYVVVATAYTGASDTAHVTIAAGAPAPAAVVLSPGTVSVAVGGHQSFTAVGKAADGSTVAITPTFAATGGTISAQGDYAAPSATGTYTVTATDAVSGEADTSTVTVTAVQPTVARVDLTPTSASVKPGATQQFTATGKAADGSGVAITPLYSATGGTVSRAGLFTAGSTAGTYAVIARDSASGRADTAAVTVEAPAPTLQSVVVTPASASLTSGATQQFAATGKMSDGSSAAVSVTWTVSGGSITSSGLYSAGQTTGTYRVIASAAGGLTDTSTVTVTAAAPPPTGGCDSVKSALQFAGNFEGGSPWSGWDITQVGAASWNLQNVSSPQRECAKAARIELRRTDPIIAGNNRAQIQVQQTGFGNGGVSVPSGETISGGMGDERWIGFSVYIPSDWVFETGYAPEVIWETLDGVRSPPLALEVNGTNWMIHNTTGHGSQNDPSWVSRYDYSPVQRGAWTDWVVHVKWSGGSTGVLQVWKNGSMIVNRSNTWTTYTDTGNYTKPLWGIYKWSWNASTSGGNSIVSSRTLYIDNVRVTDGAHGSYAAVAPR